MIYLRRFNENDFGFIDNEVNEVIDTDISISNEDYENFNALQLSGKYLSCRMKANPEGEGLFNLIEEFERDYSKSKVPTDREKLKQLEEENLSLKLALAEVAEKQEKDKVDMQLAYVELVEALNIK